MPTILLRSSSHLPLPRRPGRLMDRDGRVNPEPARRRSRPPGARRTAGLDRLAGAVDDVREAGLMRPARSTTLDADEQAVTDHVESR